MNFPGYFKDHIMPDKIHVLSVAFAIDKLVEKKGGVAGNIAYTLKLLGEKAKIIETVGKDFGGYKKYLEDLGINTDGVKVIENESTASIQIITDKADNQISAFYAGAMNYAHQASLADASFNKNNIIVLIGPDGKEGMKKRARECQELNIPYIFDPGQSMTLWSGEELQEMVNSAKILIVNDYELEMVQKITGWIFEEVLSKVETLIVTLGEKGSVVYCDDTEWRSEASPDKASLCHSKREIKIPAVKVKAVDPTGAGDAYRAGLLKGLVNNWNWEKTGRVAALCGAYAVEKYGTQEHKFNLEEFGKRFEDEFNQKLDL
jgi:adenosine kinase